MLNDCPANLVRKQCFLRFVRNANDLKTKNATIDDGGMAEFNEKIEMKTTIEQDPVTKKNKPKLASLQAVILENGQETMIGECELDLADYQKPDKYLRQMPLQNLKNGVSSKSFITVEIRTQTGSGSSPTKSKNDSSRSQVLAKATTATSK